MELTTYIAEGEKIKDGRTQLAEYLGIRPNQITDAKAGRSGLPAFACVKLAQLIGEDERRVIAASELVTEKNPERRAVWLPFVTETVKSAKKKVASTVRGTGEAIIFHL